MLPTKPSAPRRHGRHRKPTVFAEVHIRQNEQVCYPLEPSVTSLRIGAGPFPFILKRLYLLGGQELIRLANGKLPLQRSWRRLPGLEVCEDFSEFGLPLLGRSHTRLLCRL